MTTAASGWTHFETTDLVTAFKAEQGGTWCLSHFSHQSKPDLVYVGSPLSFKLMPGELESMLSQAWVQTHWQPAVELESDTDTAAVLDQFGPS